MTKWLQGMVWPTLMLWLYAVALGVASAIMPDGAELPKTADSVSRVAFALIMASWVMADANKRGRRLCYDFDAFVFFAWPIVVPVYLFQTRGARAFLTLFCFAGICLVTIIAAWAVFSVREFMLPP